MTPPEAIEAARQTWQALEKEFTATQTRLNELGIAKTAAYDTWVRLSSGPTVSFAQAQQNQAITAYHESQRRMREVPNGSPTYLEYFLRCDALAKTFRGQGMIDEQIAAL